MPSGLVTPKTPARERIRGTLKPLKIPPSPFLESLGFGTGVSVWKMEGRKLNHAQNSPWAIKNVRKNMSKEIANKYESLISKEASILRTLQNENIIGYRDYITADDGRKCLAMEMGGESLGNMIEERLENDLGPYKADIILKVALNVAKALQYLHEEKNLLHGDIKSYNIVIKDDFNVIKLCDFGVSVNLDENGETHDYIGTPIYSAPECQEGSEEPVTCKAEIFSLGLVMWEMIALHAPHTDIYDADNDDKSFVSTSSLNDSYSSEEEWVHESKFGTRPNLPDTELGDEYSDVIEVFYCCTEEKASKRPDASFLVKHLSSLSK